MSRLRAEGPYRVGIVGCGHMAGYIDRDFTDFPPVQLPYSHAQGFLAVGETGIAALADPNEERLRRFGEDYGVPAEHQYARFEEMLARESLDVLSVCTPVEHHAEPVVAAAEAGVPAILCEKPMAATLEQADRMVEACAAAGAALVIAHPRRYNFVWRRALRAVREGEIGRVTDLVGFSRGHLLGSGSHLFDTLRMLAGAPAQWVVATLDGEGDDPGGSGMVRFEGGVNAFVAASANGKAPVFEVEVVGTEGVLRILDNGCTWDLRKKRRFEDRQVLHPEPIPYFHRSSHIVAAIEDLLRCARTGERPVSDGEEGRATLELIAAFHRSHREGSRRVDLPLPREG